MRILTVTALYFALVSTACEQAPPVIEGTTAVGNTVNDTGPYEVQAVVYGVTEADLVELHYAFDSDQADRFIPLVMEAADIDGVYDGEIFVGRIPGQSVGRTLRYFVRVSNDGDELARDPVEAPLAYELEILAP